MRPKVRSQQDERELDGLDDLEELGDDAIISQQTEAHALKPRANIANEARSVVITDHPTRRETLPPRSPGAPRSSGEATLVIRDRRALDELRKNIVQRQAQKKQGNRSLYKWGALGLAAFVLGGLVAFLATDSRADARAAGSALATSRADVQASVSSTDTAPSAAALAHTVRLDDLPIESKHP
jgi:hypothetical protein